MQDGPEEPEQDYQRGQAADYQCGCDLIVADQRAQPPDGGGTSEGLRKLGATHVQILCDPGGIVNQPANEQENPGDESSA